MLMYAGTLKFSMYVSCVFDFIVLLPIGVIKNIYILLPTEVTPQVLRPSPRCHVPAADGMTDAITTAGWVAGGHHGTSYGHGALSSAAAAHTRRLAHRWAGRFRPLRDAANDLHQLSTALSNSFADRCDATS